ncbi:MULTISPECIES: MFS transporter [Halomonadaceae]|uniref:MFS transporter n=1 Tax=Halomonadaceae TaxID=28256 RepID=UPI0012EFA6E4|nr:MULTISPECIES: MFS transporter [Halomonas]CAD5275527.1 Purine ribonucleoside efflux pump nepI [Halomonas sp. 156]CAD5276431.1 Purine ribonucleoside efflux pump nepI [Halomonas sp. 113]CAD5277897.1 Purine ribonucleoside efflux pump nepI [Halomonas sp. 59]CAD5283494.1 Purine ribonucleoside efflux pump nepI [Halomonas sp. I3]VXC03098.1 Purine ribonucleoside efflux pump nepI [Halomonas titanicae]
MSYLSAQTELTEPDRLPLAGLLALAMTGFICIVTETMPAGLLPQISQSFGISPALAGQMVTAYALGSLLAAIPLTIATRGWRRRNVLLTTVVGFLIFNSATALSTNIWLTLAARFFAGVAAGLAWSLLAGYARRMVAPHQQGRALAVAMVGTPIALSLGVPLGTFMGSVIGWRAAFWIMSALALILIAWVLAKVPDYPGQPTHERMPLLKVFTTPGVRPVLAVVIAWMLAHNILYTYIAPFVAPAGLTDRIDLVLLAFGAAALAGIWITGKLVESFLRATVLASLAAFALTTLVFGLGTLNPLVVYLGVAVWGITFGGAATLLQTALADTAGSGSDVALSMNVVAWNSSIAGGGLLGGFLLQTWGAGSFPLALTLLLLVGLAIAWSAKIHGFRPGRRTAESPSISH